MNEKRFTIHKESKYKEEWYAYPFCIKEDGEVVLETIPLYIAEKVRDKLNEQQATINELKEENKKLIEEWEFSFRTEMAHHRFAEKELQEKIREKQATIKSKDKQLERLYNYFQDYLKDEMGGNAFSEMWDFVKEDERWEDE